MAISDYTTSSSVRAVLGVSDDEIENTVVEDSIYSTQLDEAFYELNPTLAADFITVKNTPGQTPTQTRFVNLVSTWSAYQVSGFLLTSVKMFAPKEIKSDKDSTQRVDDPYKDLRENISQLTSKLGLKILAVYSELFPSQQPTTPTAVTQVNLVSVGLAVDPVTGV